MSVTVSSSPSKLPPGPRGLPIFGSLLELSNGTHLSIDEIAKRYGDVCMIRLGNTPTVIISHPELLRDAFGKSELADRWVGEIMNALGGPTGLVMGPYNERWRQMQRFANRELLGLRTVENMRQRHIELVVDELVASMAEMGDAGELVSPDVMMARSNSYLMFRAIFGREDDTNEEYLQQREELLNHVKWIFSNATAARLADYIPLLRFLPNNDIKEAARQSEMGGNVISALVEAARNRPGLDLSAPTCLVEVMLAEIEKEEITDEMVTSLCMDLMLAGTDTSAQTVNWLLLLLANRPDIQAKVHEELDRVIGRDSRPTVEDRTRLPYTFACLAESMRYRTIGPFGLPHKASEDIEIGGYRIKAGMQVLGNIYSIHHDPRYWEAPHEFIPDRFLPQEDGSMPPALTDPAYIPFGTGHRRCPGRRFAETTVWLHITRMLHRLRFKTARRNAAVRGRGVRPGDFAAAVLTACGTAVVTSRIETKERLSRPEG